MQIQVKEFILLLNNNYDVITHGILSLFNYFANVYTVSKSAESRAVVKQSMLVYLR